MPLNKNKGLLENKKEKQMKQLKMKARSGVTLVELLVVILIVTILSVGLLPLLKPYIEQAKYAADVQPALAKIQTTIDLYQYEKDRLPGVWAKTEQDADGNNTLVEQGTGDYDTTDWGWKQDTDVTEHREYVEVKYTDGVAGQKIDNLKNEHHFAGFVNVTWQDLMGRRLNPSQFRYHIIKGLGAAKYGYAIGVFGDGDGLAKGTGYAILVLVDTKNKEKLIGTWERYSPESDEVVKFAAEASAFNPKSNENKNKCFLPQYNTLNNAEDASAWQQIRSNLQQTGWAFNFDDDSSSDD